MQTFFSRQNRNDADLLDVAMCVCVQKIEMIPLAFVTKEILCIYTLYYLSQPRHVFDVLRS